MIIISRDLVKHASSITATSAAAGFSASNLKDDKKSNAWRSTAISSQTITITWDAPQTIGAIGLAFTNFVENSTARVKLFTNTGDTVPASDSGIKTVPFVYPPPEGFESNSFASFAYGGGNHFLVPIDSTSCRKMTLEVTNPAGVDNFIDISRIVAGPRVSLDIGPEYGAGVSIEDRSEIIRTDSGDIVVDRRTQSRIIEISLPGLTNSDREDMQSIINGHGRHTPVFIQAFRDGSSSITRDMTIYGYFTDIDMMRLMSSCSSSFSFRLMEV